MSYKISSSDFEDFLFSNPDTGAEATKSALHGIEETRYVTPKGDIVFEQLPLKDNLSILFGNYQFEENIEIFGQGDTNLLEMHFNISDQDIYYNNQVAAKDHVSSMSGNITFLSADRNKALIGFNKHTPYHTFDVHLSLDTLTQYQGESKTMDRFLQDAQKDISSTLAKDALRISAREFCIIQDIRNCTYSGLTRRIYLESKVYELIAMSFNLLDSEQTSSNLSGSDLERIEFAAQLIRENIENPYTIAELARKTNINQTKLKDGFKSFFGNTVFGYLQEIRMNKARQYLLDKNLSIQEISLLSGYQSVSNFSAAFKKTFGYPPSKLRS